jgi:hypothetical protein
MKKLLAVLLLTGAVTACQGPQFPMSPSEARADIAAWRIVVTISSDGHPIEQLYMASEGAALTYLSEADCDRALDSDDVRVLGLALLERIAAYNAIHGTHLVAVFACEPFQKPDTQRNADDPAR